MTSVSEKRNGELDKEEGRSKSLECECVFGITEMLEKQDEKKEEESRAKRNREKSLKSGKCIATEGGNNKAKVKWDHLFSANVGIPVSTQLWADSTVTNCSTSFSSSFSPSSYSLHQEHQ